jgi:hypothetical protein
MNENIPWTGGISNRQIFVDSARGLVTWVAVTISLVVFLWFGTDYVHLPMAWRGPICGALASALAIPIARWCRA